MKNYDDLKQLLIFFTSLIFGSGKSKIIFLVSEKYEIIACKKQNQKATTNFAKNPEVEHKVKVRKKPRIWKHQ